MNKFLLTIAIPTYNRNEILKNNLEVLLPQINIDCELLILDNCSDIPVSESLAELLVGYEDKVRVRIIRHRANVGGNENILRCIEHADGSFVWLLGDDDRPDDNAIANILFEIDQNPDALVFNMQLEENKSHENRQKTSILRGGTEYLNFSKSLGELIFISNMILKVSAAHNFLNVAYNLQASCSSQLIVAVKMLGVDGKSVMSIRKSVSEIALAIGRKKATKSDLTIALGFPLLVLADWTVEECDAVNKLVKSLWGFKTQLYALDYLCLLAKKNRRQAMSFLSYIQRETVLYDGLFSFRRLFFMSFSLFIFYPDFYFYVRKNIGK